MPVDRATMFGGNRHEEACVVSASVDWSSASVPDVILALSSVTSAVLPSCSGCCCCWCSLVVSLSADAAVMLAEAAESDHSDVTSDAAAALPSAAAYHHHHHQRLVACLAFNDSFHTQTMPPAMVLSWFCNNVLRWCVLKTSRQIVARFAPGPSFKMRWLWRLWRHKFDVIDDLTNWHAVRTFL